MLEKLLQSKSHNPSVHPSLVSNGEKTVNLEKSHNFAEELIKTNSESLNKMYAFPATKTQAQIHVLSSKFGYNPPQKAGGSSEVTLCSCCNLPLNTLPIGLLYPTTPSIQIQFLKASEYELSSGVCLFFTFIKMVIAYLFIRFLITDCFNIVTSLIGTYCQIHSEKCSLNFLKSFSSYNNKNNPDVLHILNILNLVVIILSIGLFFFYRKRQYELHNNVEAALHTEDDYTIFCKDIPILPFQDGVDIDPNNIHVSHYQFIKNIFEDKIEDWLQKIKSEPLSNDTLEKDFVNLTKNRDVMKEDKVKSISLCYDLGELKKIKDIREYLMIEHCKDEQTQKKLDEETLKVLVAQDSLLLIPNQIKLLNSQEIKLSQNYASDSSFDFNLTHFLGEAFISFQYQHYRDYILREFSKDKKHFMKLSAHNRLKVGSVSQPSDIFWFNQAVDSSSRLKSIIISYLILMMVLTFSFGALVLINTIKINLVKNVVSSDGALVASILTTAATMIILGLNFGLGMIIVKLNQFEQHQTRSKHLLSLLIKTVVTQFFNTAIIYYIIELIKPEPYLADDGLVLQISGLFVTSGIIQIAINLISPSSLIKQLTNRFKYGQLEKVKMFQVQFNKEQEYVEFDIVQRYSYYLLQVFTSAFYSYLAPISILALLVILSIQYWIDKYNLFRRSSLPYEVDYILSRGVLKIFQVSILIFACGNFIFASVLQDSQISYINIVSLIIAAVYTILNLTAPQHLEKRLFESYETIETMTYSECMKQELFKTRYWTSNPGTMFICEVDLNTGKQIIEENAKVKFANQKDLKGIQTILEGIEKNSMEKEKVGEINNIIQFDEEM